MRTRYPAPLSPPVLAGEPTLAEVCGKALGHDEPVDRFTHGFHTYPAGLHPHAARAFIEALPGDSVLDPFCGGGTVLVEGLLDGRRTIGRDVSPIALLVARGRAASPSPEVVTAFRSAGRKIAAAARQAGDQPSRTKVERVHQWYGPGTMIELEAIRRGVTHAAPEVQPLLEVCFSSILVKVSWRKSDTSNQRVVHRRPPGTTAVLFHKKVRELGRALDAMREAVPEGTPPVDVAPMDARQLVIEDPVDLVLTSPPYPSTYDYVPLQQLRAVWLGFEPEEPAEIGSRRQFRTRGVRWALQRWLDDTAAWTQRSADALRPGGHLVVVIGDGLTPAGAIDTRVPTEEAAAASGLRLRARASVQRADHARNTTRWEHAFVFQKG
jgi:SAM-dependent methyltransferase